MGRNRKVEHVMDGPNITIRAATIRDFSQLTDLWAVGDTLRASHATRPCQLAQLPLRDEATVSSLIEGPTSTILVGEIEGEIVGVITLIERSTAIRTLDLLHRFVEINNMAVKPSNRRQGIGRALIGAADAWARNRGTKCLELNVDEFNDVAMRLFRSAGFETTSRRMSRLIAD